MIFSPRAASFRAGSIPSHPFSERNAAGTARTSATMTRVVLLGDAASPRWSEARLPCLLEQRLVRSSETWWAPVARLAARLARHILRLFCSTGNYPKTAQLTMTAWTSSAVVVDGVSISAVDYHRQRAAARAALTSPPERLVPEGTRVVAVGDVHGDIKVLVRTLLLAELIDEQLQWRGGAATLVQLGDVLDRGDSERECWDLLQRLKSDAPRAGGRVVCMIGNHEAMNVLGDSRPAGLIHERGETSFGPDREYAWRQGGPLATELAECPVIAIIGDSVFVHGGLPLDITREGIERINKEMRRFLLHDPGNVTCTLDADRLDERLIFQNEAGERTKRSVCPLWDRRLSSPPDREPSHRDEKALHASLKRLGVARVVVGHTVQSTINSACGGAVWRCDTGMSRWVRTGPVEALEITPSGVRVLRESARCSRLKEKKERKKEEKDTRTRIRVKSWTQMMLLSAQKKDQVETLCAMFPWAELDLVLVVLEGTSYDLEDAVDGLLSMCDV